MSVTFPEIRVGDPIRLEGLAVFPLFAQPTPGVDYDLSDEALGKGTELDKLAASVLADGGYRWDILSG